MLKREQVAAMTDSELAFARRDAGDRIDRNYRQQRSASGVVSKSLRGGSKLRSSRVAKTDWRRMDALQRELSGIRYDASLLDAEIRRRADAEKARA